MSAGAAMCTAAYHESLRASAKAFRAGVRMTFASWGVNAAGKDAEYQYGNCVRCHSTIGIESAVLGRASVYEHAARSVKVGKILALVPAGANREENKRLAKVLEAYDEDDRRAFARAAGARMPGAETWRLVCEAVRARKTALEIFRDATASTPGASS